MNKLYTRRGHFNGMMSKYDAISAACVKFEAQALARTVSTLKHPRFNSKITAAWIESIITANHCGHLTLTLSHVSDSYVSDTRTVIAQFRRWGIFIRDTEHFIVIQWNMTLCFIESQWNMPYPVWKYLM